MISKKLIKKKKDPESKSKSKSKHKRLNTFNSSQFSLLQEKNFISSSVCDLFKNDLIRNRKHHNLSVMSNKPMKKKNQTQPMNCIKKKNMNNKKTKKVGKKLQQYEIIYINPSNSNSEIMFSNEDTIRQLQKQHEIMSLKQQYALKKSQIDSNSLLRINIKKQYQKKHQAALKIQKVFRGYMTRKILQKYIQQSQQQLYKQLKQFKSIYSQKQFQRVQKIVNFESQERPSERTFKEQIDIMNKLSDQQESNNEQESFSNSGEQVIIYRHQQPIYSHEEISQYLQSSQQEDNQYQDFYEPQIIFETNQQYIESRKSSLQNRQEPKNQLINKQDQIAKEFKQIPEACTNDKHFSHFNGSNQIQLQKQTLKTEPIEEASYFEEKHLQTLQSQTSKPMTSTIQFHKNSQNSYFLNSQIKDEVIEYSLLKKSRQMISNSSEQSLNTKYQGMKMKKLKQTEKQKWDKIIQIVSNQVKENQQKNSQINNFMKSLIEISQRNKESLAYQQHENDIEDLSYATPTTITQNFNVKYEDNDGNQHKFRKKRNLQIEIFQSINEDNKVNRTNQKIRLRNMPPKPQKKKNFLESQHQNDKDNLTSTIKSQTNKLRNFLLNNIQNDNINDMLQLRIQLLEKRQSEMLIKLNDELSSKKLNQQQFLSKLQQLTQNFYKEKKIIDNTRKDIQKGYKAAVGLIKQAFTDAKTLGIKMPMSRSLGSIKYKNASLFKDVIVDQFQCYTPKAIKQHRSIQYQIKSPKQQKNNEEKFDISHEQSEDNSVDFTEQQLERFRKIKPYDSEFLEMNKNITISDEFIQQQKNFNLKLNLQQLTKPLQHQEEDFLQKQSQAYREVYVIEDENQQIVSNPKIDMHSSKMFDFLVYQCCIQILQRPILTEKLLDRSYLSKPKQVSLEEQLLFLNLLSQSLPQKSQILAKLNQKIAPLPIELLKCMRIDFSDQGDQDEQQYQQIGKYQFIIGQEICSKTLNIFKEKVDLEIQQKQQQHFISLESYGFEQKVIKYINQRDRFIKQRKQHTKGLRWEVLNIEVHCIFDAWNQQLIQLRTKKPGFSGIGLNQLTLSVVDQNSGVQNEQIESILNKSKRKLLDILTDKSQLNDKLLKENFQQMCYTDSTWIYYADQALSYGLQLNYLVQEEIFTEIGKQFNKIINKRMLLY